MKTPTNALAVLFVFAQYGFRKVSMTDIAEAAGLSRQSIYNQFGSKKAVFDWTVRTVGEDVTNAAIALFSNTESAPQDTIVAVFQTWVGNYLHIWSGTPHGPEILEMAIETTVQANVNYEDMLMEALSEFLITSNVVSNTEMAKDMSFAIYSASKGLLLKSSHSDDYEFNMMRIVRAVCRTQS
ncbi:MAG: TetR/AcrR family transcriptional regulator [Paracoccaceae bacterium]